MSVAERKSTPSRKLPSVLAAVRRRIRTYVLVEGLGLTIAAAAVGFWAALGLDWFLDRFYQSPRPVRVALVAAVGLATLYVFWTMVLRRVFARLADRHVALIVERRYKDLNDALLTSIELDPAQQSEVGRAMLADTRSHAEQRLATARLGELFDSAPRTRAIGAALVTAASIATFAVGLPSLFRLGIDRLTARTDESWPRRTFLTIEGFDGGERVVAQGSDVEFIVHADARHYIPADVYLRWRSDDNVRDEQTMEREGVARPGVDPFQNYTLTLRSVSSSLTFDVLGDDARIRGLRLRVVERPQVKLRLVCKYPPYTGRSDGELDVTGPMPLPQGTEVFVQAAANKPLHTVVVGRSDGRGGTAETRLDLVADGAADLEFGFPVGRLLADELITLRLNDVDGIENTASLSLQVLVDNAPALAVARRGLELVATPQARVPFAGKATDDYGLTRLWFEYALEGEEPQQKLLAAQPGGAREFAVDDALELPEAFSSSPLTPGMTLSVAVRGEDNRDLPEFPGGNATAGDTATLKIVTDSELLRLLEAREIMFREQFKALIEKVNRSRDGLVELGAAPKTPTPDEPADALSVNVDVVLVEQTRNRGKEQRLETLQVADGFTAIVDELLNNRAKDSDRLRERLANEIARPLRNIGEKLFADYESKLAELHQAVGKSQDTIDKDRITALQRETLAAADAILVEMQLVLDKMQELESYKEAVDLLKAIIAMQKEIGEKTKKSRGDKSRLLDP